MKLNNVEEYAKQHSHVLFRGCKEEDGTISWWFYGAYDSLDTIAEVLNELAEDRPYLVLDGKMLEHMKEC